MIVVDEYRAVRVVAGDWPVGLPDDDDIALTASRYWRSSNGSIARRVVNSPKSSRGSPTVTVT